VKSASRAWGIFALIQTTVYLVVYGSALWGARFLAPLDIAPAIFPAYKFVDPTSNGIPDNHYIIDQLTYDLPLQTVIYDAYRRGEIPWWDPYTYGGRPLLADAHINGTDPIRLLCYFTLPFELAYNWNLVLHSLVAAAGMFALLRFWRFGVFTSTTMAVAWQFSGAFVMHFGHPWIAGTFVWFPFIWICWERALLAGFSSVRSTVVASFLCGASFYSGNLQSHLYLSLFGLVFLVGHLPADRRTTARLVAVVVASGILGVALAAPVLANQLEFFLLSTREVATNLQWWQHPAKVLLSLGGVFPWATGTFRTLDVGKVVNSSGNAWLVFCGSTTFVLAVLGFLGRRKTSEDQLSLWKTSVSLIASYLLILGTPLALIFYSRVAPLAVLGIVPLASIGLRWLTSDAWVARPKIAAALALTALLMVAAINIGALLVYPATKAALARSALAADAASKAFPAGSKALRMFQVENFPDEVSIRNPETGLSVAGLLLLSGAAGSGARRRRHCLAYASVFVSLLPALSFASRFIPDQPIEMLRQLKTGGPFQQQAMELVRGNNGRIFDRNEQVFPYAMAALYKVHTIHGYSALQPRSIFRQHTEQDLKASFGADFAVDLTGGGPLEVTLLSLQPPMGRFVTHGDGNLAVENETLNKLEIKVLQESPPIFKRTDTPYPGWKADSTCRLGNPDNRLWTEIQLTDFHGSAVTLEYRPTYLTAGVVISVFGALIGLILFFFRGTQSPQGACDSEFVSKL
jgi:hypothetical protein